MYYKGQRLKPTSSNPIRYDDLDFSVYEGMSPDGKLIITTVQKRERVEPAEWWVAASENITNFPQSTKPQIGDRYQ